LNDVAFIIFPKQLSSRRVDHLVLFLYFKCGFFYLAESVIVSRLRAKFGMQCEKQGQVNPVCVSSTS